MTSRPRTAARSRVRTAGTAATVACAIVATTATGCGLVARKASGQAVKVLAEAVLGETAARFFDSVGQDREGMSSQFGGRRSGDTPELYATLPHVPACDRAKLGALLAADPAKAAEWARVQGIGPQDIGAFLAHTTPVLLNADTLVQNHRYENDVAVGYPALLQAGTAVLVDPWGRPVAKCGCGNPLAQATSVPDKIEPVGMTDKWRAVYRPKAVASVGRSNDEVRRFELADANNPHNRVVRPTGTGGEADVSTSAPGGSGAGPTGNSPTVKPSTQKPPTTKPPTTKRQEPTDGTVAPTTPTTKVPPPPPPPTTTRPTTPPPPPPTTTRPPVPAALTLSASSVRTGGSYVARATGFLPGERIRLTWTGASSGTIGYLTADANGTASTTVNEGEPAGDYRIHATGVTSGRSAGAPLRVLPSAPTVRPEPPVLTLSTGTVRVGASYVARATGFLPGERIRFTWTGAGSGTIGYATADANGTASTTVYEGAAPGSYTIHATGQSSGGTASAPLRVV